MPHLRFTRDEIARRGEEIYNRSVRQKIEDNADGKIVVIDIETSDYEVVETTLQGADRLLAVHPDAALYSLRVGYDAVYSFGGSSFEAREMIVGTVTMRHILVSLATGLSAGI